MPASVGLHIGRAFRFGSWLHVDADPVVVVTSLLSTVDGCAGPPAAWTMIRFFILANKLGQTRLSRYYEYIAVRARARADGQRLRVALTPRGKTSNTTWTGRGARRDGGGDCPQVPLADRRPGTSPCRHERGGVSELMPTSVWSVGWPTTVLVLGVPQLQDCVPPLCIFVLHCWR